MRLLAVLVLAAVVYGSPACLVLSVHPVYAGSPASIDNRLLGRWQDAETGSVANIRAGEWKSYRVTFTDRTGTITLIAFETSIGTVRLLDLTLEGGLENSLILLPLHAICRIALAGDTLTITPIDYDRLVALGADNGRGPIRYTIDDRKNVVLTSDTTPLSSWLQQHLATPGFFDPAVVFTRMPGD